MKVALVVHDFDRRVGHGRYAVELALRLAKEHEIVVYANRFDIGTEPNLKFVTVPAWRHTALSGVLTFIRSAERLIRQQRHDIIHAQGLTCWGTDVITAHICNAARYQCSPPSRLRSRLFPLLVLPLERRFYQQARARHLIAISRQVATEIATHYNWHRPTTLIYHGTDTGQFAGPSLATRTQMRRYYGLEKSTWTWLFVGEAVKGLKQVIEQLPAFREATLLVISRSRKEFFQDLARRLGVDSRVLFWGGEDRISRAYEAADVFVFPSEYDAFGLVVAEAMATELPVIMGQNIGVAEWITHRHNGLLCDPRDPVSLRAQLEWLQADPLRAKRLGTAGREKVLQHTWDACARATVEVYEQVLREKANLKR
jgi:UDP-glucose:(heptosyl)LPS alpha-1,3-glucosyltransferase